MTTRERNQGIGADLDLPASVTTRSRDQYGAEDLPMGLDTDVLARVPRPHTTVEDYR